MRYSGDMRIRRATEIRKTAGNYYINNFGNTNPETETLVKDTELLLLTLLA